MRYGDNERLLAQLARPGDLNRGILRKLQRYVVNIPRRIHQHLLVDGAIQEQQPGVFVQITHLYDPVLGFQVEQAMNYAPDDLIVWD